MARIPEDFEPVLLGTRPRVGDFVAPYDHRGVRLGGWREIDERGQVTWPPGTVDGRVSTFGIWNGHDSTARIHPADTLPVLITSMSSLTLTLSDVEEW